MQQPPLLELESVGYKQYGTTILQGVSWTVDSGRHWALLGPNGSGKTTLLKVAVGYLWQTSGRVRRRGAELADLGEFRREIGWISADMLSSIPADETALETVVSGKFAQFGLKYLYGTTPTSDDLREAHHSLEQLGCGDLQNKRFGVLSQGERQQVLVARAQMAGPTLLVLDEACAGMDPGVKAKFLAWLDQQLQDSRFPTTLFATHHIEEIVPSIDLALILRAGRITNAGDKRHVLSQENLEAAYGATLSELREQRGRFWPIWSSPREQCRGGN